MKPRAAAPIILLALGGCAGAGPVAPARALAYGVPTPATVDYLSGDSARIQISVAGQSFAVRAEVEEIWRMAFAPAGDPGSPAGGTRVTATLVDMKATMTNPLSAPATADESAVVGPVVFTLDPQGRATVEAVPTIKPIVAQFMNGNGIAQGFFPRLPGRPVSRGQVWTDTVSYSTEEGGARTTVESVTTFTAAGDSVESGRTYLLVRTAGTTRQDSAGRISGADFNQSVQGTTSGSFLWDVAAGVLHALVYTSELTGTMAVPISPQPLSVAITSTIRQRRVQP